jgi:hypothetical protein
MSRAESSMNNPIAQLPILLTSCIFVTDKEVALLDPEVRIKHALESIAHWLIISPKSKLVLCDGSAFDFSDLVKQQFLGAQIECLSFRNDEAQVAKYGRGYGEAEIVSYAIEHSSIIAAAGAFAKCSSKLWVNNFIECEREWNGEFGCKAVFHNIFSLKPSQIAYIDTRFYMSSVAAYQRYFSTAHHGLDAANGISLEECFLAAAVKHQLQHFLIKVSPVISGVGGGIGRYYKHSMRRLLKENIGLHLIKRSARFKALFV